MKHTTSFKEYLASKEQLKMALEDIQKVKEIYEVEKYCSIPIIAESNDDEPVYIKLKPKDLIEILWENYPDNRNPKYFSVLSEDDDDQKKFAWSNAKVRSWVKKMTRSL